MIDIESKISPYIAQQFPRLYQEQGPAFIAFTKAYFEWLEQPDNPVGASRALLSNRDIDTTLDQFIDHFKKKYMAGFPTYAVGDKRFLQKHIKELFGSKGTEQGVKLLFRLLYNLDVEVYYPGSDVFKLSDGVWSIPQYLEISITDINPFLIGESIVGSISGANAVVETFQVKNVNGRIIHELGLSNIRGEFQITDTLLNSLVSANKSPFVLGSLGSILINESGFNYNVGDVLTVSGGSGINGKVVVQGTAPRNGVVTFQVQDGGSGYTNNAPKAPTIVTVTPVGNGNPGIGATFSIGELINTSQITTAVDVMAPYANVLLGANDYAFPGETVSANLLTPMSLVLDVETFTIGTIATLTAIDPGSGYNGPVNISVVCPVVEGLEMHDPDDNSIMGNNAVVVGFTGSGNGTVSSLAVYDSGIGYLAGDQVTMSAPNNDFVVGGVVGLQAMGTGTGAWKNTKGFLDSDKYVQDSFYYQDFSYETRASVAFERYAGVLKDVWHLAGTQPFGKLFVVDELDCESNTMELLISLQISLLDGITAANAQAAVDTGLPFYWEIGNTSAIICSGQGGVVTANNPAITANTQVPLASVTKSFSAATAAQLRALTSADWPYLTMTAGRDLMQGNHCPANDTIGQCAAELTTGGFRYDQLNPAHNHIFSYDGGSWQYYFDSILGFGTANNAGLKTIYQTNLGLLATEISCTSAMPSGGAQGKSVTLRKVTTKIMTGTLNIKNYLTDTNTPVPASEYFPTTQVFTSPAPPTEPWLYKWGFWVEPGGGYYWMAGSFGTCVWISRDFSQYGMVIRSASVEGGAGGEMGVQSLRTAQAIREAFLTGIVNPNPPTD